MGKLIEELILLFHYFLHGSIGIADDVETGRKAVGLLAVNGVDCYDGRSLCTFAGVDLSDAVDGSLAGNSCLAKSAELIGCLYLVSTIAGDGILGISCEAYDLVALCDDVADSVRNSVPCNLVFDLDRLRHGAKLTDELRIPCIVAATNVLDGVLSCLLGCKHSCLALSADGVVGGTVDIVVVGTAV